MTDAVEHDNLVSRASRLVGQNCQTLLASLLDSSAYMASDMLWRAAAAMAATDDYAL